MLLCVFCLSVFAGCGPREFVKTEEPPTEAESAVSSEPDSTEPQTDAPQSLFPFAPYIKMGMTLAETQAAIGQVREVTVREGHKNFLKTFQAHLSILQRINLSFLCIRQSRICWNSCSSAVIRRRTV